MTVSSMDGRPAAGPSFVAASVGILHRRWHVAGWVALAVVAVSMAILFLPHPIYRSEARLKIGEPPPSAGVSPTGGLLSFLRLGGDPFSNDLEILSSRTLAEGVVRDAALSVAVKAPRGWYRDSLFTSLELSPSDTTAKATFEVRWEADGMVAVRRVSPDAAELGTFAVGVPADFGGVRAVFAARRPDGPESVRMRTIPFDEAVRKAASHLDVNRTRREANVLEITYNASDPGMARQVVESAVHHFLGLRTHIFERESTETVDSLRTVADQTHRDLRRAEDSLEVVQRSTGLVAPDAQSEALVSRYEKAYAALQAARIERDELDAQMVRVGGAKDRIQAWSTLVAHPRFLENETVGRLLQELTGLEARRTDLLSQRRAESLDAKTLDAQIAQMEESLEALVREYRTSLVEQIEELGKRVAEMDGLLHGLPAQAVELGRRQRSVKILSQVLVLTEQRLREEELRQALAFSNVQVIDPPALRYRPVWPRPSLGIAVALVLALASGLLSMVLGERADTSLRRALRIRELTGSPVLAAPMSPAARLRPEELEVVREAAGGACVLVPCGAAASDVDAVALALSGAVAAEARDSVGDFAAAAALARNGVPIVLVVRAGSTSEADLAGVMSLLRGLTLGVAGTVVVCGTSREREALWN